MLPCPFLHQNFLLCSRKSLISLHSFALTLNGRVRRGSGRNRFLVVTVLTFCPTSFWHTTHVNTRTVWLKVILNLFYWSRKIYNFTAKSAHPGTPKRNILRPISPKSPVASASAFESVEGSDDDDDIAADNDKLDTTYLHTNGNVVSLLWICSCWH